MCIRDSSYPSSIADYPALDAYKAVVLDSGKSLNVALSGAPDNGEGLHVRKDVYKRQVTMHSVEPGV